MAKTQMIDHKTDRSNDSEKILNSSHPRKVVLAGPGTGKSFLFEEAIKQKKKGSSEKYVGSFRHG